MSKVHQTEMQGGNIGVIPDDLERRWITCSYVKNGRNYLYTQSIMGGTLNEDW